MGINPAGARIDGRDVDGVLPDDQRRGGAFQWPPLKENYVYEALQGALVQAVLLSRLGHDVWRWQDQALLRAFSWLHTNHFSDGTSFPAEGDDQWEPHVVNHFYGTRFAAPERAQVGKNMGFTDWTLGTSTEPSPCTEALVTLRAATGISPCSVQRCDADGDGLITVSDALVLLKECTQSLEGD